MTDGSKTETNKEKKKYEKITKNRPLNQIIYKIDTIQKLLNTKVISKN